MSRVMCNEHHWVRCGEWMCYRYSPEDPIMPVVALEHNTVAKSRGCVLPLRLGATRVLVLKVPWGRKQYIHGGSLPWQVGQVYRSRCSLKKVGYVLPTDRYWILHRHVSGPYYWTGMVVPQRKKGVQGHSEKKQTDQDDVCRACTRHVQLKKFHRREPYFT